MSETRDPEIQVSRLAVRLAPAGAGGCHFCRTRDGQVAIVEGVDMVMRICRGCLNEVNEAVRAEIGVSR